MSMLEQEILNVGLEMMNVAKTKVTFVDRSNRNRPDLQSVSKKAYSISSEFV